MPLQRDTTFRGAVIGVLLLALILRLVHIFVFSEVTPFHDAGLYWDSTLGIRATFCKTLPFCAPRGASFGFSRIINIVVYRRIGILPLIMGLALTILPSCPESVYVVYALLDVAICAMVIHTILRLGGSHVLALLAAFLYATSVPAILGSGTVMQQPLIRFGLAAFLWANTVALTEADDGKARKHLIMGTLSVVLVGYSSLTTRPLMWIMFGAVILIHLLPPRRPTHVRFQAILIGAFALTLVLLTVSGALVTKLEPIDFLARMTTGLSRSGSTGAVGDVHYETTIVSFPYFWTPSDYLGQSSFVYEPKPFFADIREAPIRFSGLLLKSIHHSWRYPHHVLLQEYLLTIPQQNIQHYLMVGFGVVGLLWLVGQPGDRQKFALLIAAIVITLTGVYSMITAEVRRLTVFIPFLALCAAFGFDQVVAFIRHRARWQGWEIGLLLVAVVTLAMPVSWLHVLVRNAAASHTILVLLRVLVIGVLGLRIIRHWQTTPEASYRMGLPIVGLLSVLIVAIAGGLQSPEWRAWSAPIESSARTQISDIEIDPHLWPWLLIDVSSAEQAENIELVINGDVVKAAGVPMQTWEAPHIWDAILSIYTAAKPTPQRNMWFAYPLTPDIIAGQDEIIIEVTSDDAFELRGDTMRDTSAGDSAIIPLLSPWYNGHSSWYWIWDGAESRPPGQQTLNGTYQSSVQQGDSWQSVDLSSHTGLQTGLYRIYVVGAAFGPTTNALSGESPYVTQTESCQQSPPLETSICQDDDGTITYYSGDTLLGSTEARVFQQSADQNQHIDQFETDNGRVEVLQVMTSVYVANVYAGDELVESFAFDYQDGGQ